ncbi:MAG: penicillin-binding protein 2 [Chloroflexi bacterium]|nr:penicillin-binding protein 2 [Chloroflexota bacterium]
MGRCVGERALGLRRAERGSDGPVHGGCVPSLAGPHGRARGGRGGGHPVMTLGGPGRDEQMSRADPRAAEFTTRRFRSMIVRLGILLAFGLLTVQLWRLQIVEGLRAGEAASENSQRQVSIPAPRGVIYDRKGEILARNTGSFVVAIVEKDLPTERRAEVLGRLAGLLGTGVTEIEASLDRNRDPDDIFNPVPVRTQAPREVAFTIAEHGWELPGVQIVVDSVREYAEGPLLAHVLGYLGSPSREEYEQRYRAEGYGIRDKVGISGVEASYEAELRGRAGQLTVEVDAAGQLLRDVQEQPPTPGENLQLTIDLGLQRAVSEILDAKVPDDSSGVAIVADPRNGELLALVSIPTFDPDVFSRPGDGASMAALLSDANLPLFNRAISGQYPPGSVFKLVTGIGALEERTANRNTTVNCNGQFVVPNEYFPMQPTILRDWGVLGRLNFVQGLAQSCNVYFYTLGGGSVTGSVPMVAGLGAERLATYAERLGYGEPTGIDLPGEEAGRIPTPAWKIANMGEEWLKGDTYHMAIGQGDVLATPLQVADATNAIANGGPVATPHLGMAVKDDEGQTIRTLDFPATRTLGLRPDVLSLMWEGMRAVLETDQLKAYRLPNVVVAGKTGTAEHPGAEVNGNLPTHGWFTSFAPAENPEVAVTVFLEKGGGPSDATPVAMDIMKAYFDRRNAVRNPAVSQPPADVRP